MKAYFNSLVRHALIFLAVIASGCSSTSTAPVNTVRTIPVGGAVSQSFHLRHAPAKTALSFKKAQKPRMVFNAKAKPSRHRFQSAWDRLLSLYALPDIQNERIDRQFNWYLNHPDYLARVQERAEPYLHHILNEIEEKEIPGEMALLPVVESAFIPEAYSRSDASGLWQFIPATGRLYGLQQNSWYDGRRDIYASTKAAAQFLKELGETFDGDWFLALAAYNYGKGNVRKAIDKNLALDLPTDYWSLDLPKETQDYVPRLLAIARIFAHCKEFNVPLHPIPDKPHFEAIDIGFPLDLNKAAEMANVPITDFLKLNPGFNRSCTAPSGPHRLLIPVDQVQAFKHNLAQLPFSERINLNDAEEALFAQALLQRDLLKPRTPNRDLSPGVRAAAGPGATLDASAGRLRTTLNAVGRDSPPLAGNALYKARSAGAAPKSPVSAAAKNRPAAKQYYVVKKGDTFWNISQRFLISPSNLAAWNNISTKAPLLPGRKLIVRSTGDSQLASAASVRLIRYTVGKGDTLTQISKKFNISVNELRKANADVLARGLQAGQKLKILIDEEPAI